MQKTSDQQSLNLRFPGGEKMNCNKLTEADRRQWLARTERELARERAWLADCRRHGQSTIGAEMTIKALEERKAELMRVNRTQWP
jgi:hypothetical protein